MSIEKMKPEFVTYKWLNGQWIIDAVTFNVAEMEEAPPETISTNNMKKILNLIEGTDKENNEDSVEISKREMLQQYAKNHKVEIKNLDLGIPKNYDCESCTGFPIIKK